MTELQAATFAGGCFWCTEAIFKEVKGVTNVVSGYAGPANQNPDYETVSSGNSEFVEAIQIQFNSSLISFEELVYIFLRTHDPTTLNRQGYDVGSQYRSVIFAHNSDQRKIAQLQISKLSNEHIFQNPIVTSVEPFSAFYKAEEYHQNFYKNNSSKPYCTLVINPKLSKFKNEFKTYLK